MHKRLLVAILLLGCTQATLPMGDAARASLAGHRYASIAVSVDGQPVPLVRDAPWFGDPHLELVFGWSTVEEISGCNHYNVQGWAINDGRLSIGTDWDGTLIACSDEQEAQDRWIQRFLASSPTLTQASDRLVLSSGPLAISLKDAPRLNCCSKLPTPGSPGRH